LTFIRYVKFAVYPKRNVNVRIFQLCSGIMQTFQKKERDGNLLPLCNDIRFPQRLAASGIFSVKIPYPLAGSFTRTWVTAHAGFLSCTIGLPLRRGGF
jgi:hypothetical protein